MRSPGEDRAIERLASWLLATAFACKLALVVWALGRGLELGDEGYFLLNLNHPEGAPAAFQFYRLVPPWGQAAPFGVWDARVLRLAVEAVATLALVVAVYTWARRRFLLPGAVGFVPFLLFCLLGSLLGTGSRAFGYNDMSNLCTCVAVAALFVLAAADGSGLRSAAVLVAGFASGLELGVKFTSAASLFGLAALALLALFPDLALRERLRLFGLHLVGALGAGLLFVARGGGVAPLLEEVRAMPELARLTGYDPFSILALYAAGEVVTVLQLALLALAVGVTRRGLSRRTDLDRDTSAALALLAGAFLLACATWLVHPFFLQPTLVALAAFLSFLLLVLTSAAHRLRSRAEAPGAPRAWRAIAPLLLLIALPLVNILGTNVPLSMRLPSHALPLFAALAVLAFDLRSRTGYTRMHLASTSILVALTTALFVQHHLRSPYGLARPIWEQQHEPVGLPGIRVDAPTRDFLEAVALRMHETGFRPGAPVVALDYMPGLVAYLGGTSPGSNLYLFDRPELNCIHLNRARDAAVPYFLLGHPMSPEQSACLDRLDFERDLVLVDRIPFPYREVYERFDAAGISHVYLYAPKRDVQPELRAPR